MNVQTLDLSFRDAPETIASYLVTGPSGAVIVDPGPSTTLDVLQAKIADAGVPLDTVGHVLVTHVHLDHAGSSAWWARRGARVHVHERGAPHIADPSRLLASARRVYGDSLEDLWGQVLSAPADRVAPVSDGDVLDLGGLRFRVLGAPGHASHHVVYIVDDLAFTGDAAGVRLPGTGLVDLPAPPPEFDREAWYQTLDRLESLGLGGLFPTHFGRVDDVATHLRGLRSVIAEGSGFIRGMLVAGAERDDIVREYHAWSRERMRAAGVDPAADARYELANPFRMSVDGLTRYWQKRGVGLSNGDDRALS